MPFGQGQLVELRRERCPRTVGAGALVGQGMAETLATRSDVAARHAPFALQFMH